MSVCEICGKVFCVYGKPNLKRCDGVNCKKPVLNIIGNDGNAFAILCNAKQVADKNGMDWETIEAEATSGDYDTLLQTMTKYFEVQ